MVLYFVCFVDLLLLFCGFVLMVCIWLVGFVCVWVVACCFAVWCRTVGLVVTFVVLMVFVFCWVASVFAFIC